MPQILGITQMDVPEAMSTPRAGRSWMHSLFHEWRDATGFLNFCRLCNVDQPSVDEVLTVTRSGGNIQSHWFGAVTAETASGMINLLTTYGSFIQKSSPMVFLFIENDQEIRWRGRHEQT